MFKEYFLVINNEFISYTLTYVLFKKCLPYYNIIYTTPMQYWGVTQIINYSNNIPFGLI